MVDELENEEDRLSQEHRRDLIKRLDASEEQLRELEERRRVPGRLSEEELAREIELERERNRSLRGFGQAF